MYLVQSVDLDIEWLMLGIVLSVHPEEWRKQWFSMIPAARLCDPCELKGAYVFLASDASSYMTGKRSKIEQRVYTDTVEGANMVIDGAYTLP